MARESSGTTRTKIVENAIKFLIIEVEHEKLWKYQLIDENDEVMYQSPVFNNREYCKDRIMKIKYALVYDIRLDVEQIDIGPPKSKNI